LFYRLGKEEKRKKITMGFKGKKRKKKKKQNKKQTKKQKDKSDLC